MKKLYYLFIIIMILAACRQTPEKLDTDKARERRDRLTAREKDTVYTREWMKIDYGKGRVEEIEVYVSEFNDTISNQYKPFFDSRLDTLRGEFYDLTINKTGRKNVYKGIITIHSKYENLKLDKHNRKSLEFNFCEQNLDSIWITTKTVENVNTLEFEFENAFGKNLQGVIYQKIERDTLLEGEPSFNLFRLQLLVDNQPQTLNLFLEAYGFHKENIFNKNKLKLIKK
jgi:hypothetical protein